MNPMIQLIGAMRNSANPEQFMLNLLTSQAGNNPILANILELAKGPNPAANIEQVAKNFLSSQGLDFDKEFNDFKQVLGVQNRKQ